MINSWIQCVNLSLCRGLGVQGLHTGGLRGSIGLNSSSGLGLSSSCPVASMGPFVVELRTITVSG